MSRVVCTIIMVVFSFAAFAQTPFDVDSKMTKYGLVDIQSIDDSILVDLKYSSTDNFVGKDMYGELSIAYLTPDFAQCVVRAQKILKQRYPQYTLLIYDAARPISVQRAMRRAVEGTEYENFVADGSRGGRHNYGVAVDLTIATLDGVPLDMGTGFDDFSEAASVKGTSDTSDPTTRTVNVYKEYILMLEKNGVITSMAASNRILLVEIMCEAGLVPYRREWWHYEQIIPMSEVRSKYKLLDF